MPDPSTWEQVLDDIDDRVDRRQLEEWRPPAGLGPIPDDLRARATATLARISAAITSVSGEIGHLDARKKVIRRVPTPLPADTPRYLDEAF